MTEEEAIAEYRKKNYPKPALTADCVIFARQGGVWKLLMIRRGGHPYLGCWALPGGFADEGETIDQAAARELEEETGLKGLPMKMVGVYSAPGRDPRGWTVSVAYAARLPEGTLNATAGDDAAEARWIPLRFTEAGARPELPDGEPVAFDHAEIIADAARLALGN